jgi:carbonic anhydrase/acetyltransferase-like protein (isoleucine patch superfamily)
MIWAPVVIGSFGIVNGGATVAAGATLADRCVVGGMAFVARDLPEPLRLYAGVPAREVKPLDPQGLWFDREHRAALMHYRRPQLHAEWEAEVAAEVTVPES